MNILTKQDLKEPENVLLKYAHWLGNRYTNQDLATITLGVLVNSISNFYADMRLETQYTISDEKTRAVQLCKHCGGVVFTFTGTKVKPNGGELWHSSFTCTVCDGVNLFVIKEHQ